MKITLKKYLDYGKKALADVLGLETRVEALENASAWGEETFVAGETIAIGDPLYTKTSIPSDRVFIVPDNHTFTDTDLFIGYATSAALVGENVTIKMAGIIEKTGLRSILGKRIKGWELGEESIKSVQEILYPDAISFGGPSAQSIVTCIFTQNGDKLIVIHTTRMFATVNLTIPFDIASINLATLVTKDFSVTITNLANIRGTLMWGPYGTGAENKLAFFCNLSKFMYLDFTGDLSTSNVLDFPGSLSYGATQAATYYQSLHPVTSTTWLLRLRHASGTYYLTAYRTNGFNPNSIVQTIGEQNISALGFGAPGTTTDPLNMTMNKAGNRIYVVLSTGRILVWGLKKPIDFTTLFYVGEFQMPLPTGFSSIGNVIIRGEGDYLVVRYTNATNTVFQTVSCSIEEQVEGAKRLRSTSKYKILNDV